VANPGAIATRCETSFPTGAPQRCGGKSTGLTLSVVAPDGRLTDGLKVGAGARKVSVLLGLAQVEFRPPWAPPISMPILLPSTACLPSVLRRIALSTKTSDSGNGVPCNRNTGQTTNPRAHRTASCKHSIGRYYLSRSFIANDALKIITKACQDLAKRPYYWLSITIQIIRNIKS
jgi:hypothetical protein